MFSDESYARSDKSWRVKAGIDGFNNKRHQVVMASRVKAMDKAMPPFATSNSKCGSLPNILFIICKPEPLGIKIKYVCYACTGILLHVEIQHSADKIEDETYCKKYKPATACFVRTFEATVTCGQDAWTRMKDRGCNAQPTSSLQSTNSSLSLVHRT